MDPYLQAIVALGYTFAVGVPTLLFYGWIAFFGRKAWVSLVPGARRRVPMMFALIAILPLIWYGTQYTIAIAKKNEAVARVRDADRQPKLAIAPRTLVIHGARAPAWQDRLVEMGAFDTIFVTLRGETVRVANARRPGCDGGARGNVQTQDVFRARMGFLVCATENKVNAFPSDGLQLHRIAPESRGQNPEWEGFNDLRWIEGYKRQQAGFHGAPSISYPSFPPVLTLVGFQQTSDTLHHIVPWHGEIPFLLDRLGLDAGALTPAGRPSQEEVRAEFLRLRDSPLRADQNVAGYIASATGASLLSADDVMPVLQSNSVDTDLASQVGYQQFCYAINRLCDFPAQLVEVCKSKRLARVAGNPSPGFLRRCERIPQQCNWCKANPQCQPTLGHAVNCTTEERAALDRTVRPLRED